MLDKGKTIMADASLPQNIASLGGTGFESGWGCDWSQGLTKLYSFAELINYITSLKVPTLRNQSIRVNHSKKNYLLNDSKWG